MNRRTTLRGLLLSSGALVALPSWAYDWSTDLLDKDNSFLSSDHEAILSRMVDTMIPPDEKGMGGLKVGVDKFLIQLLDRCYEKEIQDNVLLQIKNLEDKSREMFAKSIEDIDNSQIENLLLIFAQSENEAEKGFFELIKSESIRGFRTSREVMTRYHKYRVAPGHFHGCVDIDA